MLFEFPLSLVTPIIFIGFAEGKVIKVALFREVNAELFPKYVSSPQVYNSPAEVKAINVFFEPLTATTFDKIGFPAADVVTKCHCVALAAEILLVKPLPAFAEI